MDFLTKCPIGYFLTVTFMSIILIWLFSPHGFDVICRVKATREALRPIIKLKYFTLVNSPGIERTH